MIFLPLSYVFSTGKEERQELKKRILFSLFNSVRSHVLFLTIIMARNEYLNEITRALCTGEKGKILNKKFRGCLYSNGGQ